MNILHIIDTIQIAAGTTTFVVRCAEEQQRLGHQVLILTHVCGREQDARPNVPVMAWNAKSTLKLPFTPDVAHIHGIWLLWYHCAVHWLLCNKIPTVLSPHGSLSPWSMHHKWWKKYPAWWLWQRWDMKRAIMLHSTAPMESQWLRNLGFTQPIVEAPLGTEVSGTIAQHDNPVKFVSFVGRIYPIKGLDLFLRTWAQLKTNIPGFDWHFVAIGPDQAGHMGELTELARSLGLTVGNQMDGSTDVAFIGATYGKEKDALLLKARLSVLPSYSENFGGVVLDALALGVPVLASTGTPWGELAPHGCGEQFQLTVESEVEALMKWLTLSDEERKAAGLRGREWMTQAFSWPAIAQRVVAAYKSIVK